MISLASKRHFRYRQLNQREDLDKEVVHLTELILLPPLSRLQRGPNILASLFLLASALLLRSTVYKQPEDAICATKYFSHLRDQPNETPSIPRYQITALLVDALALQVELEAGNVTQNIREMVVLSRELLETSDVDATHFIIIIHAVATSKIRLAVPGQPLDELIEFSRVARKRRPDLLLGHMTLAMSLVRRYHMAFTFANGVYEEAASVLDEIIVFRSPGNSQDGFVAKARAKAKDLVTELAIIRSTAFSARENLAMHHSCTCASSSFSKERFPGPLAVFDLEATAKRRFRLFGSIEGVEESPGNSLADVSSQEYTQAADKMEDVLFGIRNTGDLAEIDEAIERSRSILVSSADKSSLNLFSDILSEAFDRTGKIEHLNESISVRRQFIESPLSQFVRAKIYPSLSQSLLARRYHFPGYRTQDVDEALELYSPVCQQHTW